MPTVHELYNEADRLKDEGKHDEAIAKLNELLAQDEKHVLAHLALAVLYFRTKNFEQSVRHGQRACELDPTDPFNFTAMSVTYQRAFAGTQNRQYIQLAEEAMARAHMLQGRH
jgi:tetratricopeptide (TPR) repeat protein